VIENTANIFFDFNDPVITEPSVLVAEFSTGVRERGQEQLFLQPNPASERLSVSSTMFVERVEVFAADGRVVLSTSPRSTKFDLFIDQLSPGAYVLLVSTRNGSIERQRFIKH
ncbi:MAG: T9SS type A sorting domain-containing protein, partial [Flavobacteriales bacterium]